MHLELETQTQTCSTCVHWDRHDTLFSMRECELCSTHCSECGHRVQHLMPNWQTCREWEARDGH